MQTTAAAAAAMMFPRGVAVAGSDVIRVGVVGSGGRGTGASPSTDAPRTASRSSRSAICCRIASRSGASTSTRRPPNDRLRARSTRASVRRARLHRLRRLPESSRVGHSLRDPRHAARVPPGPSRGRRRRWQAHLHGEAGGGRFGRHPLGARHLRQPARRTSASAPARSAAIRPSTSPTIERIHDGAIGDVLSGQVFWNQGGLWNHARQPAWSDAEWQIRNWLYFTWLSGDHIVEQHVHNIDVANWVLNAHPVKAVGAGGRQ